ncbi:uncharacterized protein LOC144476921 isoform X2 [Augochlora pura]
MTRFIVFATLLAVHLASGCDAAGRRDQPMRVIFLRSGNAWTKYAVESFTGQKVFELQHGSVGELKPVSSDTTFCQLRDPNGVQTPMIIGNCLHNISVVTPRHAGIWTAVYGVKDSLQPGKLTFEVRTRDPQTIESTVDKSKPNEIRLACRVNISKPQEFGFCHFTRPDGRVLSLSHDAVSDGYKATTVPESGKNSSSFSCDIIIMTPKTEDYGAWRCRITILNDTSYGTVLQVRRWGTLTSVKVVAQDVYVRQSDTYQMKCTADAALSYCWFRSPNGTAYSVAAPGARTTTPFTLPYIGAGLLLGDCSVEIARASFDDRGKWMCNVGVVNGSEEQQSFDVHVAESYVVPEQSKLTAAGPGDIILSCNIFPNAADRSVRYCRWIRPDGHGFHDDGSRRYPCHATSTRCELIIRDGVHMEDLGNWTCVAGLLSANSTIEESQATITVYLGETTFQSLLGVSVALTTMLMIIVCMLSLVYLRRKLKKMPTDPPPYTVEPQSIPRFMKAEYDSKEFRY